MRTVSSSPSAFYAAAAATTHRSLEDSDPCALVEISAYDHSLHIAAIFVLFVASVSGVALPLLPKYSKALSVNPYYIVLGKCAGAGVMLSCSLVHMILPSTEALTSECLPPFFSSSYPAFSFFFALLAALASHLVEFVVESIIADKLATEASGEAAGPGPGPGKVAEEVVSLDDPPPDQEEEDGNGSRSDYGSLAKVDKVEADAAMHDKLVEAKQLSETLLVEFSLSVHSIFVGLALGVSDGSTLVALLVALIFHQFLEGVALGCRLADSSLGRCNEAVFTSLFSVSCSIGVVIGIALYSTLNTNGEAFLLVSGILDGICGGLLLYNGFLLLLTDFSRDLKKHCLGARRAAKVVGMFASLWIAALVMSLIGAWA
jgi:solute carrier family 39 (zinc transporter), member 1/2/3